MCVRQKVGGNNSTVTYTHLVTYIRENTTVWRRDTSPFTEFPVSVYTYPFEYQLSQNIPHSFESIIEQVTYKVLAEVTLSGLLKSNHKAIACVNVRENIQASCQFVGNQYQLT